MAATLNYKNMVKQYYRLNASSQCWKSFYIMRLMGFIDSATWNKFYDTCNSWYFNKEDRTIRDCFTEEIINV